MILLKIYGKRSIGHNSTFRGSHPEDSGEVRGNGNVPCVLEDDGNLWLLEIQMHMDIAKLLEMGLYEAQDRDT